MKKFNLISIFVFNLIFFAQNLFSSGSNKSILGCVFKIGDLENQIENIYYKIEELQEGIQNKAITGGAALYVNNFLKKLNLYQRFNNKKLKFVNLSLQGYGLFSLTDAFGDRLFQKHLQKKADGISHELLNFVAQGHQQDMINARDILKQIKESNSIVNEKYTSSINQNSLSQQPEKLTNNTVIDNRFLVLLEKSLQHKKCEHYLKLNILDLIKPGLTDVVSRRKQRILLGLTCGIGWKAIMNQAIKDVDNTIGCGYKNIEEMTSAIIDKSLNKDLTEENIQQFYNSHVDMLKREKNFLTNSGRFVVLLDVTSDCLGFGTSYNFLKRI